jgi:8-oxo-dGTP pyrophosphatase MutT (NUDIX family)
LLAREPAIWGSLCSLVNPAIRGSGGDEGVGWWVAWPVASDGMQRFSSIVLVDARGWVLLQERDEHPAIDPEKWGFVGGHLDDGEEYEAGAYRELEEETGLRLDGGLELFAKFTVHHAHSDSDDDFCVFAMRTDLTDDDLECHEGRQIVFVEPSRARGLDLTAAAAIALPAFLDSGAYAAMTS